MKSAFVTLAIVVGLILGAPTYATEKCPDGYVCLTLVEFAELRKAQEYQTLETAKWKHRATSLKYPTIGCGASYYFTFDGSGVAPSCSITWGWRLSFFGN